MMSFPPGTEMFQFPGFASGAHGFGAGCRACAAGCPIRIPPDQSPLAAPRGLSQRAASFIASRRLGIHRVPFSRSPRPGGRAAGDGLRAPSQSPRTTTNGTRRAPRASPREVRAITPHVALLLLLPHARARDARARVVVSPPHDRKERPRPACAAASLSAGRLVGPGRLERPTSRLSGARSDLLSYGPGTGRPARRVGVSRGKGRADGAPGARGRRGRARPRRSRRWSIGRRALGARRPQKGGDPAAGSPTATLLRLHPSRKPGRGRPPPHRWGWPAGFGQSLLPWCDGRCVQGPGTYSPRRADPRLLAIPPSRGRVAARDPNRDGFSGSARARALAPLCRRHCSTCVARPIGAMRT